MSVNLHPRFGQSRRGVVCAAKPSNRPARGGKHRIRLQEALAGCEPGGGRQTPIARARCGWKEIDQPVGVSLSEKMTLEERLRLAKRSGLRRHRTQLRPDNDLFGHRSPAAKEYQAINDDGGPDWDSHQRPLCRSCFGLTHSRATIRKARGAWSWPGRSRRPPTIGVKNVWSFRARSRFLATRIV